MSCVLSVLAVYFLDFCSLLLFCVVIAGGGESIVVGPIPHVVVGEPRSPLFHMEQVPPSLGRLAAAGGRRGIYSYSIRVNGAAVGYWYTSCLLYTSPSPRD